MFHVTSRLSTLLLLLAPLVAASPAAAQSGGAPRVLHISDGLAPQESLVQQHLQAQGMDVTRKYSWSISRFTDLSPYDLIVLSGFSPFVSSSGLARIAASGVPTLVGQPVDMHYASGLGMMSVLNMACNWASNMDLLDNAHPITSCFRASESFYSYSSLVCGAASSALAPGVRPLVNSERWPIVDYPAVFVDDSRNMAVLGIYDTLAYSGEAWTLFDNAVCHIMGTCAAGACVDFDADSEYASAQYASWYDVYGTAPPPPPSSNSAYNLIDSGTASRGELRILDCSAPPDSCERSLTPELKIGSIPPLSCTVSSSVVGRLTDCAGHSSDVERRVYTASTELAATSAGCAALEPDLAAAQCAQVQLEGGGGVQCTTMPEVAPVSIIGNAEYDSCVAAGRDPVQCALVAQDCITTTLCPHESKVHAPAGYVSDDPKPEDLAINTDTENDKYWITSNPINPKSVEVYPCDLLVAEEAESVEARSRGTDEQNSGDNRFDFKKGSDMFFVSLDAGYRANNGFERGGVTEGADAGVNLAFDALVKAGVFGEPITLLDTQAGAGSDICGLHADYHVKVLEDYISLGDQPGDGLAHPSTLAERRSCLDALANLRSHQKALNDALWNLRLFGEYWNQYADADGNAAVRGVSTPVTAGEVTSYVDAYNQARRDYDAAAASLNTIVQNVLNQPGAEHTIFDSPDALPAVTTPEIQQSIPIGPFAVTVAGQMAGRMYTELRLYAKLTATEISNAALPAPSADLGLSLVPGADVGGWVFVGTGISVGVAGAAVGVRGSVQMIDLSFPVSFGFGVEPRLQADDTVDWVLSFHRDAFMNMVMLSGQLDLEVRAWIDLLFTSLQKSWLRNLASWDGLRWGQKLDDTPLTVAGILVSTPNFFGGTLPPLGDTPSGGVMPLLSAPPPVDLDDLVLGLPTDRDEVGRFLKIIRQLNTDAWTAYQPPTDTIGESGLCLRAL
ncbi:MAG: hypothetical protein OEZ06_29065 [Myxococcales bacterium]|nr:hypothetical protein [Myxococcales bacterium]